MKPLIGVSLLMCTSVFAAAKSGPKVLLEAPITYQADASVNDKVREECKVEALLLKHIGPALKRVNRQRDDQGSIVAGEQVPTTAGSPSVLRVKISNVMGIGGGAWTGPKSITVVAELLENGQVVRDVRINRWTTGGVFGGLKSTCSILERPAILIGKDLGRWVADPKVKLPAERGVGANDREGAEDSNDAAAGNSAESQQ